MDRHQIGELLSSEYKILWRWALHCASWDREAAHDALQNAIEDLLSGSVSPKREDAWKAFVLSVIKNYVKREKRSSFVRRLMPFQEGFHDVNDPLQHPETEADAHLARRAIQSLSARQRDIAWLVFACDLTLEEAAAVIHMPVGTARTHYARAKNHLHKHFSEKRQ
ncbi:MAG: sigma-70 family RNA polymerase sigma factor [Rhizobiaceae bacterium]|nr:sigma-70 family RNA polymerase sigma factor [Rhizobiaceae bacterium]